MVCLGCGLQVGASGVVSTWTNAFLSIRWKSCDDAYAVGFLVAGIRRR